MVLANDFARNSLSRKMFSGKTWTQIVLPPDRGGIISLHTTTDKTLVFAAQNGVWRYDAFQAWNRIATPPTRRSLQRFFVGKGVIYGIGEKQVFSLENGSWKPVSNPSNSRIENGILDGDVLWGLDNAGNLHRIDAQGWTQVKIASLELWSSTKNIGFAALGGNFWFGLRDRARELFRADKKAIAREAVLQINTQSNSYPVTDITENLGILNQTGEPFGPLVDFKLSVDGFLYASTDEGIWRRSSVRQNWERILMGSNFRVFPLADSSLLTYNSRTRKTLLWRDGNWFQFPDLSHAINSACLIDSVVYVSSGNELSSIEVDAAKSMNPPNPEYASYLNIGKVEVACDHNQQVFLSTNNQLWHFNPQSYQLKPLAPLIAAPVDICGVGDYIFIALQTPIPKTKNFHAALWRYDLTQNQLIEIFKAPSPVTNSTRVTGNGNYVVYLTNRIVRIFDLQGNPIAQQTIPDADFVTNAAIFNNRVYVVGFRNQRNTNPQGRTLPVQSPFLNCYEIQNNNALVEVWKTWGFPGRELGNDMADGRLYQVFASDRQVCVLGESAGGNSAFRWNGKNLSTPTLITFDAYNDAFNSKSAHFTYYGIIDPVTGTVQRGQFAIPRLTSMMSNTNRARTISAGSEGYYIGTEAMAKIENRDMIKFMGKTPILYSGKDAALLKVSPDLRTREFWFTPGAGQVLLFNESFAVITVPVINPKTGSAEMPITSNGKSRQNGEDTYVVVW